MSCGAFRQDRKDHSGQTDAANGEIPTRPRQGLQRPCIGFLVEGWVALARAQQNWPASPASALMGGLDRGLDRS
jgi:hypothetical protein